MNKAVICGRLTRDPEIRRTQGQQAELTIARFTLAVDRRIKRDNEPAADFIQCVAFGKIGEFAEKYLKQGTKVIASGRIQTGSYTDRDGKKVYTTDVVLEECEFAESKASQQGSGSGKSFAGDFKKEAGIPDTGDGFMNIPDSVDDDGLPFH